jgi:hypothetical protein
MELKISLRFSRKRIRDKIEHACSADGSSKEALVNRQGKQTRARMESQVMLRLGLI